jgi:hypothetical protein
MHAAAVSLARFTVARCDKCHRTYVIARGTGPHCCTRPVRRQPAAPAGA